MDQVREALRLASWGFNVLPAAYREKSPVVKWTAWQSRRTDEMLRRWFNGRASNYWVMGGSMSGVVVLDIDNPEADRWWRDVAGIGEAMDRTACVRTSEKQPGWWGHHYYFRIKRGEEGGARFPAWSNHPEKGPEGIVIDDAPSFDVRGDGTGVIAPPSIHESGVAYEWVRSPEALVDAPEQLEKAFWQRGGAGGPQHRPGAARVQKSGSGGAGAGAVAIRSTLTALLERPAGAGGRNNWLSKVAGHYAKQFRGMRDLYDWHCRMANRMLDPELEEEEFAKTVGSIWESEHQNHPERAMGPDSGFLGSGDYTIICSAKQGDEYTTAEYADFDLDVQGVIDEGDGKRAYDLVVMRKRDRQKLPALLEGSQLADSKQLETWLAGLGVSVMPPEQIAPRVGSPGIRLRRYLEAQGAPLSKATDHLGWHPGLGFVTFDSLITSEGRQDLAGIRPSPRIRGWGDWNYGFAGDEAEALDVLRWVMEFREPQYAAVFSAWLTAVILKGQFESELFPIFSIESRAETGKSRGFFALMMQLFGNRQGPGQSTVPAMRDIISSNSNGAAWIDDATRLDKYGELLREMVVEGSVSKKAQDRTGNESVKLRSALLVTGEGLGSMTSEPAIQDRFVRVLSMPSPKGRMSDRDPGVPQILEIDRLNEKYGKDLSRLAGWVVAAVLREGAEIAEHRRYQTEPGRIGAVNGVLRSAARVFASVIGDTFWVRFVDEYCESRRSEDNLPFLVAEILPYALRQVTVAAGAPRGAYGAVWVDDTGIVQVSAGSVADAWNRRPNLTDREKQLGSAQAIGMDLTTIGAGPRVTHRLVHTGVSHEGKQFKQYRALSPEWSKRVLELTELGELA